MDPVSNLRDEVNSKMSKLADEDIQEVADFVTKLMQKKEFKQKKKDLDYSWIGSLNHLKISGLELQKEAMEAWENLD